MTDEQSKAGQEPEPTPSGQVPDTGNSDAGQVSAQEAKLEKARQEAAKWRTQFREAETQIKELAPLAEQYREQQEARKSEAEKQAARIADLEQQMKNAETQAAQAAAESQLLRMATKAGVDPDVAALIDLSKLDLADEEATIAKLQKFAPPTRASSAANPQRSSQEESEQSLMDWYKNRGSKVTGFG